MRGSGRTARLKGINAAGRIITPSSITTNYAAFAGNALRIPVGQAGNYYNLETGVFNNGGGDETGNMTLADYDALMTTIGVENWIIQVNMSQSDKEITDMLEAAQALRPVTHVELGNENFADDQPLSTAEYVAKAQTVVPAIRAIPTIAGAKIGGVAMGKIPSTDQQIEWNPSVKVLDGILDAWIYHCYMPNGKTDVHQRITQLAAMRIVSTNETWVTEFGAQYGTDPEILSYYLALTEYFESNADVETVFTLVNFTAPFQMVDEATGNITTLGTSYLAG